MPYSEAVFPLGVPIAPTEPSDVNPTHIAEYGRGGCMSVVDISARDLIPSDRLTVGMLVYVQSLAAYYTLTALPGTWAPLATGGALNSISREATADTILASGVWTAMTATMSLTAGTWLVVGTTTVTSGTNHAEIGVRIWNSTASRYIVSTSIHIEHQNEPHGASVTGIVTLSATSTISFDANADVGGSALFEANGSGSKTCRFDAVRIA